MPAKKKTGKPKPRKKPGKKGTKPRPTDKTGKRVETGDELGFELNLGKLPKLPKKVLTGIFAIIAIMLILFAFTAIRKPSGQPAGPEMPQEPEVVLTIINDDTCSVCSTGKIEAVLKTVFPNLRINRISANTQEGKRLIGELHFATVPAYYFDKAVTNSTMYPAIASQVVEINGKYVLKILGNKLITHEEIPNKLDLYIMSTEQYGIEQSRILFPVLEDFPEVSLSIYYIASEGDGGLASYLGEPDLEEDMRQLCINKHYPALYQSYILCRGGNITADWTGCLSGVPQSEIQECVDSEGEQLLLENVRIGRELGVGASPTIIVNNQILMLGLQDEKTIRFYICDANPQLSACQG